MIARSGQPRPCEANPLRPLLSSWFFGSTPPMSDWNGGASSPSAALVPGAPASILRPVPVLLTITELEVGGAERALVELATRLDPQRWRVMVVTLAERGPLAEPLRASGIETVALGLNSIRQIRRGIRQLSQILLERRIELVQSFLFHANLLSRWAVARLARRHRREGAARRTTWGEAQEVWTPKVVLSGVRVADPRRWRLWLDRRHLEICAGWVCVSEGVKRQYLQAGFPESKLFVIPNGVDPQRFVGLDEGPKVFGEAAQDGPVALFVGRLERQKGWETLIEAAARLHREGPNLAGMPPRWFLAIVGDGPDRERLARRVLTTPGLKERVAILGFRADADRLIASADLLVSPSRWEGMPNVVLEAMAAGKPVIGTRVQGTEDLVIHHETGLLVPPDHPASLAKAMYDLLRSRRMRREMGMAGLRRVVERFSLDAVALAYDRLWSRLLNLDPPPPPRASEGSSLRFAHTVVSHANEPQKIAEGVVKTVRSETVNPPSTIPAGSSVALTAPAATNPPGGDQPTSHAAAPSSPVASVEPIVPLDEVDEVGQAAESAGIAIEPVESGEAVSESCSIPQVTAWPSTDHTDEPTPAFESSAPPLHPFDTPEQIDTPTPSEVASPMPISLPKFVRVGFAGDRESRSADARPDVASSCDSSSPPARLVIEKLLPEVDGGAWPVKRTLGESLEVTAHIFADGHDVLRADLLVKGPDETTWRTIPLVAGYNDEWRATIPLERLGLYQYKAVAWIDQFASWRQEVTKKFEAGQPIHSELLEGAAMIAETARQKTLPSEDQSILTKASLALADANLSEADRYALVHGEPLTRAMANHAPRRSAAESNRVGRVLVERERARFSSWYELFPRSCSPNPGVHGRFDDLIATLPRIAAMGFDVVYLPPIHPIGTSFRKGRNNALQAEPGDVGSPWAIGSPEGGHDAIHPELGTVEDFKRVVAAARYHGLEIALDIAIQCSPDHPYVQNHPQWFRHRPDGSIKYAENPPKKYQDIYPLDFECEDWRALWEEMKRIFLVWIERGVKIFRVDNPHTKPFAFWEWLIDEVRRVEPETIFLAEAFTRPKPMAHLAKRGFSQSYSYFTWRNTKAELTEFLTELTRGDWVEFYRPNFFANTPDILSEYLQHGGRPATMVRLILAATLGTNYGIYGPVFERCEVTPARPGSEEYLDSEKYQLRYWGDPSPNDLSWLVTKINQIRRDHPALQFFRDLEFHPTDSDHVLCYSKIAPDRSDAILVAINLDPHQTHWARVEIPAERFGRHPSECFEVHDLLTGARYPWSGGTNTVGLDPQGIPAHVFHIEMR